MSQSSDLRKYIFEDGLEAADLAPAPLDRLFLITILLALATSDTMSAN